MIDSRSLQEKLSTFQLQMAANPTVLGPNLKAARKDARLTLAQVAERAHVSVRSVSKWEAGEVFPSWDNLERVARVLKRDVADLLEDPDTVADNSPTIAERFDEVIDRMDGIEAKLDRVLEQLASTEALGDYLTRRQSTAAPGEYEGVAPRPVGSRGKRARKTPAQRAAKS